MCSPTEDHWVFFPTSNKLLFGTFSVMLDAFFFMVTLMLIGMAALMITIRLVVMGSSLVLTLL